MAKLEEKPRKFLDENPFVGVATTLREDGSPHSTIVWVDVEGDKVRSTRPAGGRSRSIWSTTRVPRCWSSTRTTPTSGSRSAARPS